MSDGKEPHFHFGERALWLSAGMGGISVIALIVLLSQGGQGL